MLRIGIPSTSSKFYHAASARVFELLGINEEAAQRKRQLVVEVASLYLGQVQIIYCRGRDLARYVGLRRLDVAFTGYDVWVDYELRDIRHRGITEAWHVGYSRPARLALAGAKGLNIADIRVVLTEYPEITAVFLKHLDCIAELVPVRGSVEGLAAVWRDSACVTTVRSGETLRSNGLIEIETLATTDLCAVVQSGQQPDHGITRILGFLKKASLPSFAIHVK